MSNDPAGGDVVPFRALPVKMSTSSAAVNTYSLSNPQPPKPGSVIYFVGISICWMNFPLLKHTDVHNKNGNKKVFTIAFVISIGTHNGLTKNKVPFTYELIAFL